MSEKKEYIEREAVLDGIDKAIHDFAANRDRIAFISDLRYAVIGQPAADVRPVVRGEWINEDVDWVCSICGHDAYTEGDYRQVRTNFCPNCGADMRKED